MPTAPTTTSSPARRIEDYWSTIGRVDHVINDKNRMFVRVHRDFWQEDKNRSFGNDVNGIILNRINRAIAFDDVHVFTPDVPAELPLRHDAAGVPGAPRQLGLRSDARSASRRI